MFRNYVIIALRNLKKHRAFSLINLAGLSLSMSVCLVIITLVAHHFEFDKFHPDGDRTYRVLTFRKSNNSMFSGYASSPLPVGEVLDGNYASVEKITQLNNRFRGEIRSNSRILTLGEHNEGGLFADNRFFEVFGFDLEEGNPANALSQPYSLVLSEKMADLLFPDGEAVGKTVEFSDHGSYTITGIAKDPPGDSHIQFQVLASLSTLHALHASDTTSQYYRSWENGFSNYNYVVLRDPRSVPQIEKALNAAADEHFKEADDPGKGFRFELQPMHSVTPGLIYSNEIGFRLPWFILAAFALLGLIVISTASINYANLSIAKALSRAREIGIRKANGASSKQIMAQFLVESLIMSIIALLIAMGLYTYLLRSVNELWIFSVVGISFESTPIVWVYFLLFAFLIGVITGVSPAMYLARLKAVRVLKNNLSNDAGRRGVRSIFSSKKLLLAVQFGLSFMMLISVFVLQDQMHYLIHSDYGFDEDHTYFVDLQNHDPRQLITEFGRVPGIEGATLTSHHPAIGSTWGHPATIDLDKEPITLYYFSVDPNYVDLMRLQIVAGRDFPDDPDVAQGQLILSELAAERLGFDSPGDASGSVIHFADETYEVIGVIKNYHWEHHMKTIRPLALRVNPEEYNYAYFKSFGPPMEVKQALENKWNSFDPARDYAGGLLNEELDLFYQFMRDLGGILQFVAWLAIGITTMGFLGMVSFDLRSRLGEISIRKVLGASYFQLVRQLTLGFVIMLGGTGLLFIPLSAWLNGLWLQRMANHVSLGLSNVGPAIAIILLLSAVVILTQVWASASRNPAEVLRGE